MTTPARLLVSADPYVTAVHLLQAAGVPEPASAARICLNAGLPVLEALAFLANTTETAAQVVGDLARLDPEELASLLNMDHISDAVAFQDRLASRTTGGNP